MIYKQRVLKLAERSGYFKKDNILQFNTSGAVIGSISEWCQQSRSMLNGKKGRKLKLVKNLKQNQEVNKIRIASCQDLYRLSDPQGSSFALQRFSNRTNVKSTNTGATQNAQTRFIMEP